MPAHVPSLRIAVVGGDSGGPAVAFLRHAGLRAVRYEQALKQCESVRVERTTCLQQAGHARRDIDTFGAAATWAGCRRVPSP